jgi:hypothetical protein
MFFTAGSPVDPRGLGARNVSTFPGVRRVRRGAVSLILVLAACSSTQSAKTAATTSTTSTKSTRTTASTVTTVTTLAPAKWPQPRHVNVESLTFHGDETWTVALHPSPAAVTGVKVCDFGSEIPCFGPVVAGAQVIVRMPVRSGQASGT